MAPPARMGLGAEPGMGAPGLSPGRWVLGAACTLLPPQQRGVSSPGALGDSVTAQGTAEPPAPLPGGVWNPQIPPEAPAHSPGLRHH